MRNCKKCNNIIPWTLKTADNRIHNLCGRKYCLICSPFNLHNTKKLEKVYIIIDYFTCIKCLEIKDKKEYYYHKQKRNSYCKKCFKIIGLSRLRSIKKKSITYKGGKCQLCGYNKYQGALHFHHNNPDIKKFSIGDFRGKSFEKITEELDKCTLLCANCHAEKHAKLE